MITLYPYQEQALRAEALHRRAHPGETRLAIVMATGLGKTVVMAEKAIQFLDSFEGAGNRVLILTHTDEISSQVEATVRLMAGQDGKGFIVGVVKADRDEVGADIVIGSVQTLANPIRRQMLFDVGLVIVDECHHALKSNTYGSILRHFGCIELSQCPDHGDNCACFSYADIPVLGFTATLERGDGASLGGIWQNVAFTRDISWGVRHGYLVQPVGHRLEIDPGSGLSNCADSLGMLDSYVEALAPEKMVEKWIELAKGRPTVAFMPLVKSARTLAEAFKDAGIQAAVIHGGMPKQEYAEAMAAFEAGRIDVLCNAMKLTEGWDPPKTRRVSCVIVGRPTKSRTLFIQMVGRGLRPDPFRPVEEQDCIVICVTDSTTDLCTVADLSDKPLDRRAQGALTVMEDEWDIGKGLEDPEHLWTGRVDVKEFDPLANRSAKVWRTTEHGTPFLPISKNREYVFIVGTSVFVYGKAGVRKMSALRLHKDLPSLELAMTIAEDEAQERGGDIGRLLADRSRAWRKQRPSEEMIARAEGLGLTREVERIMADRAGGKAGKVSDLINKVVATRTLEPMVERIKEATK